MRLAIWLAEGMIAFPAAAHDSSTPIADKEPLEHVHFSDEIWKLILPQAEASASITVDGNSRRIRADGYPDKALLPQNTAVWSRPDNEAAGQ